ncbi:MAG: alanine racemase [Candidatus Parcubacteria bacterium]|nr:alanine racemase [Candidatus Parcubacteria bacterium]
MLTYLEINKSAITHNLRQIKKLVGPKVDIMAIVKSNAYGHGMVETAKIAIKAGANWLGVISDSEALSLRQAKVKASIFILSFWDQAELKNKIKKIYNCDFPIYSIEQAKFLSQLGQKIRKTINIHIKIDTGASRVGIRPDEAVAIIKKIKGLPKLNLCGIFTHYAASEDSDQSFTNQQTDKFTWVIDALEKQGVDIAWRHAACSAATLVNRQTRFNLIRLGIVLYGLWPSPETKLLSDVKNGRLDLKPALAWKTRIIQIKDLPGRITIGYDRTYQTKKKIKLAILPVGYWDGYDRKLSNCGEVLINGQRCPVRGRVCMNLTMVEVPGTLRAKVGDEAVLLGRQGKKEITAEELAQKIGTINYEVVTRINPLIVRQYI